MIYWFVDRGFLFHPLLAGSNQMVPSPTVDENITLTPFMSSSTLGVKLSSMNSLISFILINISPFGELWTPSVNNFFIMVPFWYVLKLLITFYKLPLTVCQGIFCWKLFTNLFGFVRMSCGRYTQHSPFPHFLPPSCNSVKQENPLFHRWNRQ